MKNYLVTSNLVSDVLSPTKIVADKLEILPTGQFVLYKNQEIIAVFNKECIIVSVDDEVDYVNNTLNSFNKTLDDEINKIDEWFMTDVFFKKNNIKDAQDKLRKIKGKISKSLNQIKSFKI